MYPASEWRIALRALDDDPHVSVLLNPSVTRTHLSVQVFRHAAGLFFRLLLSSTDPWNESKPRRGGGGKVECVLCFPSAASFPRPSCSHGLQRLMSVLLATRQHGPGHTSEFVSDSDDDFVAWCTLRKPVHPLPESSGIVLDSK